MPPRSDPLGGPAAWAADEHDAPARARRLGVSVEAVELVASSDVVDLHVESFIWTRVAGYDLARWHRCTGSGSACGARPTSPGCARPG